MYSIAIDGPAGAGKSTIAKLVANEMNFVYIDTGAMYRAFALYCLENNISTDDEESISKIVDKVNITIENDNAVQNIFLNNQDVSQIIRSNEISHNASKVSVHKCVRLKLVELQRSLAKQKNVVMDGRDIGTYVLPDAYLKIFLDASVDVRADRRFNEMREKGIEADLSIIKEEIIKRDERDMNREFAPLKCAKDAILIDTSFLSLSEVTNEIIRLFNKKGK